MTPWTALPILAAFGIIPTPRPHPPAPRFELATPCPGVPGVMIDTYGTGLGLASETAKAKSWQARIMWIDATANIDRYNTVEKIQSLAKTIHGAGFNTVVLDVKPISGQTIYPSKFAPKLTEWRNQTLPESFDPVPPMIEACHSEGLSLMVSMNAFSEGHRLFKVGPGYAETQHQTTLYVPQTIVSTPTGDFPVAELGSPATPEMLGWTAPTTAGRGEALYGLGLKNQVVMSSGSSLAELQRTGVRTLFGLGPGAGFLKQHFPVGSTVSLDTRPEYIPISAQTGGQVPLMMDPNDPEVQAHALEMINEVASKYPVDGIIYDDRLRYSGLNGDFSETSRAKFEASLGVKVSWPDDVFKYTITPALGHGVRPGKYYDAWMAWRAKQIQDYVAKVRITIKAARPAAQFGVYVGSWYGDYPALGNDDAATETEAGFWFLTPSYRATGTAPLLDFLICGCYYPTPTIYEAMSNGTGIGSTIEAAGGLCNRLVGGETWTYAGIDCGDFAEDPAGLARAVQAACASTQGVMVFDLSHDMDKQWATFAHIFLQKRIAPHQVLGSSDALRAHHKLVESFHLPRRPIIIAAGTSGTGQ
jgi:Domain of unknown function/Glycosyl hydrolase-like 10